MPPPSPHFVSFPTINRWPLHPSFIPLCPEPLITCSQWAATPTAAPVFLLINGIKHLALKGLFILKMNYPKVQHNAVSFLLLAHYCPGASPGPRLLPSPPPFTTTTPPPSFISVRLSSALSFFLSFFCLLAFPSITKGKWPPKIDRKTRKMMRMMAMMTTMTRRSP